MTTITGLWETWAPGCHRKCGVCELCWKGFILCLLLSTCKSSADFSFWHLRVLHTYFRAEIQLAMGYIFFVQYTSLNVWDKLLSAANLACWEACVGMTLCGHNKKVLKRVNILNCGSSSLFDFRMKGCLMQHHSRLVPASLHGVPVPHGHSIEFLHSVWYIYLSA